MGYRPTVFEQAKFDYCPLGKILNKGLEEEDKEEGLLKRLRNTADKNEEQLEVFSEANKISRSAYNESDYNYDNKFAFYKFHQDFGKFKKRLLGPKYSD